MEHTPELDKALSELKRITGITISVKTDTPEETELAFPRFAAFVLLIRKNIINRIF